MSTSSSTASALVSGIADILNANELTTNDLVEFTFKDYRYKAFINFIDGNILHIIITPSGQKVKLYNSHDVWLIENRVQATDVRFSKNEYEPSILIEDKVDFTGAQLTDLKVLALLNDFDFNSLCRTNQHLGRLCRDPDLQNEIYEERTKIHLPQVMKYVTHGNYKEIYQKIRALENTQLFKDIFSQSWDPAMKLPPTFRDPTEYEFKYVPHVEVIKQIIKNDDLIALKYLMEVDDLSNRPFRILNIWKLLSFHIKSIARLLAENGVTEILNWLIRSGEWKAYFRRPTVGLQYNFREAMEQIVQYGLDFGTTAYIDNLISLGIYTGDPRNRVPANILP